MVKKIALISGLILALVIFYNLSKQLYDSLEVSRRLDREAENLTNLQKRNVELKGKLEEVGSLSFVEREARDKLGLVREGETMVIIPPSEIDKILGAQKEVEKIVLPYWQGWLKLFIR